MRLIVGFGFGFDFVASASASASAFTYSTYLFLLSHLLSLSLSSSFSCALSPLYAKLLLKFNFSYTAILLILKSHLFLFFSDILKKFIILA